MRRLAGNLFIDHRCVTELVATAVLVAVFLLCTGASNFDATLDEQTRSSLYTSLAGTLAALLGFVLAALAILVALPSSERLEALRGHPRWPRVPSAYFRAARALLVALVLSTLGIALDGAKHHPWTLYEVAVVATLAFALVRVTASVVALDQIVAVARADQPAAKASGNGDPGP